MPEQPAPTSPSTTAPSTTAPSTTPLSTTPLSTTVWLIDDDDRFRERLERALTRRGHAVRSFPSAHSALEAHAELTPLDLAQPLIALVDLRLGGEWGLHLTRELLERQPELHVIILTAYGSIATAIEAVRIGARDYLQKPVSVSEIEARLIACRSPSDQSPPDLASPELTLADVEWEHINRVLTECDGNIRRAARRLGIHRRTLQRKLAKLPNKR